MNARSLSSYWLWLLKAVLFLLSCAFIFWHVRSQLHRLHEAEVSLSNFGQRLWSPFFLLVLFLAFLNWSIEAIKWRLLLKDAVPVSTLIALRAFFNGVTVSFFTPNRLGEFAGRIIYLPAEKRIEGALLGFLGSTSQLLVTLQMGLFSLLILWPVYAGGETLTVRIVQSLLALFILLLTFLWIRMPGVVRFVDRWKIRASWKNKIHVWDSFRLRDLLWIWALSLLRYAVFTMQPLLLFYLWGVDVSVHLVMLVPVTYLLITAIPSIALGELGIRGSVNLAIFGLAGIEPAPVLIVTFLIWCINLALPAAFGAFSVLFVKFRNTVRAERL